MENYLNLFSSPTAAWFQDIFGQPTSVQEQGWPAIASGRHVLLSAPTGTGKTLTAFLIFIDRLKTLAAQGKLDQALHVIYVSPLKSLGNDIRENLRRPLEGIAGPELSVAIRTGDTTSSERQRMLRKPPHILITTPESLYLLLTGTKGQKMLSTSKAVIIDELHALINNKRGAHLMFSLARLDRLCSRNLQRIGLSATIEPLTEAAAYLGGSDPVTIVAPRMTKSVFIEVNSPLPDMRVLPSGTIWPEIARLVYNHCQGARTVIAFADGRMYAEKLAYHVNQLSGSEFARTHHGCVSKEQRLEAEQLLRSGQLRLLCATSSMELGIDVGEVDLVLQIGNPPNISSTMQRLGRAGHNPGRTSIMHIFPRTVAESIYCGLTARIALNGGLEQVKPPHQCLDILAQHLVSMAAAEVYTMDQLMPLLKRTYSFRSLDQQQVEDVMRMLAGDFEYELDRPARPRILYDRIHGTIEGDAYSRMLAVSSAGTIPDRGWYAVHLPDGTKLGELDEEFVFEARVGDKFLLGSFAWKIIELTKDKVLVTPASSEGARPPFWKGDKAGRPYQTGLAFGALLRGLTRAYQENRLLTALQDLQLDMDAAVNAADFLRRQIEATGMLPDDRTIIIEHFNDEAGEHQMMVHSVFGRPVNIGLSLLMQEVVRQATGRADFHSFDDEDGFLIYPLDGSREFPEGLLQTIRPEIARPLLSALLPMTSTFNMAFRYNASRALMMGTRPGGFGQRLPLWIQRMRSAEFLDQIINQPNHPLMKETRRECLENYWDLPAIEQVLHDIQSGHIQIRELHMEAPSPLSLPLRRQVEGELLYDYHPTSSRVLQQVNQALKTTQMIKPEPEQLEQVGARRYAPQNARQLHAILLAEGDLTAGEMKVPEIWLEDLAQQGRACYIEPGLWIGAEHLEQYGAALQAGDQDMQRRIVRRCLRYRGPQNAASLSGRYFWTIEQSQHILNELAAEQAVVEDSGWHYHKELYNRAGRRTVALRRKQAVTMPAERYAALMSQRLHPPAAPKEQLAQGILQLLRRPFPPGYWEDLLLPIRIDGGYRPDLLEALLSEGVYFWQFEPGDKAQIAFYPYSDIDWEQDCLFEQVRNPLTHDETVILTTLKQRGATFAQGLAGIIGPGIPLDILLTLMEKGLVRADSFMPVRQWLSRKKIRQQPIKRQARWRVQTAASGRWECIRPLVQPPLEEKLEQAFDRSLLLCRETAEGLNWRQSLEILRIWEYAGRIRRGYFIQGLTGAQFIREKDYVKTLSVFNEPDQDIIWVNAADPAQVWGKALPYPKEPAFTNLSTTAVALGAGQPVAVLSRQGQELKVLKPEKLDEAIDTLSRAFKLKRIFPARSHLTIKKYPSYAAAALEKAGFKKQMLDYQLWK